MQKREHEVPSRTQDTFDCGENPVEIVDVGQPEAAHHNVEGFSSERVRCRDVGLYVANAKRFLALRSARLFQQRTREINPDDLCAAPCKETGEPPVPTGKIEEPTSRHRPDKTGYLGIGRCGNLLGHEGLVQVRNLVVASRTSCGILFHGSIV
jgi:hypothetical protein